MVSAAPATSTQCAVVGLTGGIAVGKSLVRRCFETLGVPCLDGDAVARAIHQDPAHPATQALAKEFPDWMTPEGALQRGSLQGLFANNADANGILIATLKPDVLAAFHTWTSVQRAPFVIWESALLIQEAIAVDRVLIVEAAVSLRAARLRSRNPDWCEQHIVNMLAAQARFTTVHGAPRDTIQNNGSLQQLQSLVANLHRHYLTLWN
jgi:dephospho-CoA kinase